MRLFILFFLISLFITTSCGSTRDLSSISDKISINLSKQGLTELPIELKGNKTVKVLRLYGNNIDSLPEWVGELENLEKLYLGKNKLKSLPESIGKLKHLKLLSAQYNDIEFLPGSIVELTNLEQLILNQNQIKFLPDSIGKLKKLDVLQLKFNKLKKLPISIGKCENLQFVYLNRNFLEGIPNSFGDLRKLRELHISGAGPLLSLPESMCGMRYLEVLEIDRTVVVPTCLLVLQTNRLRIVLN